MHDRYHVTTTRNTSLNRPGMCTKTELGNTQARSLPQKQIAANRIAMLSAQRLNAHAWSLQDPMNTHL